MKGSSKKNNNAEIRSVLITKSKLIILGETSFVGALKR
jgi:hypothetical protein